MTDSNASLGAPPRQRLRPWHIILIVVGAVAIFGVVLFTILSWALGPVVASGDSFMGALKDGAFDRAYASTTPALQRELGDSRRLALSVGSYRPLDWSWSQRVVRNGVGRLEGAATYQGGRTGTARLTLQQVDGEWRVAGFALN